MKASRSALAFSVVTAMLLLELAPAAAQSGQIQIPREHRQDLPTLELTNPGRGRRQPLRIAVREGAEENGRIEMRMRIGISMGGRTVPPQDNPPIRMGISMRVTDVAGDGTFRYEFRCTSVTIVGGNPQIRSALEPALAPLRNMEGWAIVDAQGRTLAADVQAPGAGGATAQVMNQLRDTVTQLMPPFPTDPVGVGARWRTEQDIQAEFEIHQRVEYELLSRRGNTVRLRATVTQHADPQDLPAQGGVQPRLEGMDSTGTATYTQRLDHLVPTSEGNIEATVRTGAGQGMPGVEMRMGVEIEVAPAVN